MSAFVTRLIASVCLAVVALGSCARQTGGVIAVPGFRPESDHAAAFMAQAGNSTVAVYPSIVRTVEGTSYSTDSQKQIVALLNDRRIITAAAVAAAIDPGELTGRSQWDMFQNDLQAIAGQLVQQGRPYDQQPPGSRL